MKDTPVRVTLTKVERMRMSESGNPRWRLITDDGRRFMTEVDGSVGYEVDNLTRGLWRMPRDFDLFMTSEGVWDMKPVSR